MASRPSVVVIGGGVIGVCSAYYLSARGLPVTLVDKRDVCAYAHWNLNTPSLAAEILPITREASRAT